MMLRILMLSWMCIVSWSSTAQVRFVLPDELTENSGLIITDQDSLWWINDGNNPSILYQTNRQGEVQQRIPVPATNIDWEDLAVDEMGNFLIGDFGNNRRQRNDLCIYRFNPTLQLIDTLWFSFPQPVDDLNNHSWNHNTEAMVWHEGKIHLFTKGDMRSGQFVCHHFTLDPSLSHQIANLVESIQPNKSVVTSAAISPDGKILALLAYRYRLLLRKIPESQAYIHFYKITPGEVLFFDKEHYTYVIPTWLAAGQYESIDFTASGKIIISAEGNKNIKPFMRTLKMKIPFKE